MTTPSDDEVGSSSSSTSVLLESGQDESLTKTGERPLREDEVTVGLGGVSALRRLRSTYPLEVVSAVNRTSPDWCSWKVTWHHWLVSAVAHIHSTLMSSFQWLSLIPCQSNYCPHVSRTS
eukprot:GHVN01058898.1.p2 GENE.GHVN01058898.1~~GHVN01058898.1.p2  ORF type:complete len:120 (+),score=18.17 GHVN01058898.1:418-777(+)